MYITQVCGAGEWCHPSSRPSGLAPGHSHCWPTDTTNYSKVKTKSSIFAYLIFFLDMLLPF